MHSARVYLVGAGPGDPDLLTVKAHRLLGQADAVVHDRLVPEAILRLARPAARRIFAGKQDGHHALSQERIHELLLELARSCRCVVRLKGGDPFVFGRGGEEAAFLAAHGIAFEIVPGLTAAGACAAYAGIPLTHRGLASGVRFVTGHGCGADPPALDWRGLADPDTTLVVYMGLARLAPFTAELIAAGLSPATPAAAIERGTTGAQRRVLSALAALPGAVQAQGLRAPVLLVIGRVVSLAPGLDWFETAARALPAPQAVPCRAATAHA